MTDNIIKLNNDNVLRLKIETSNEIPLKYQDLLEKDKKNKENLKNQFLIIDKRQDVKGKKLLSKNEEDKIKALNDFFKKEIEVYNMFLGDRGVEKLLNGRKFTWTTLQEIDEIIEKQITPYLDVNMKDITNKIKEKYGEAKKKTEEQIEVVE